MDKIPTVPLGEKVPGAVSPRVLVTGFKPFLGSAINPSERLALELKFFCSEVECLILPVEFKTSFEILKKRVEELSPDYLIMLGQASGRARICIEKIGLNWIQTEHRDEAGFLPQSGRISSDAPLALMSEFPTDKVFFDLRKQDLPVEISFSAGAFVCNDLYFRTLKEFEDLKSVFIHLPLLPEQLVEMDERPRLAFSEQLAVLKAIVLSLRK